MTEGYLYCMSNPSMPNIYKIGNIFDKTPEESLALINKAYPHALPTEYKYEIIKKVSDIFSEQEKLYDLLNEHTSRTNTDYFSGSLIIIREIFKLVKSIKPIEEKKYYRKKLHHDMRKCFISDQLIRHNIKKGILRGLVYIILLPIQLITMEQNIIL